MFYFYLRPVRSGGWLDGWCNTQKLPKWDAVPPAAEARRVCTDALCCLLFVYYLPRNRHVALESKKNSRLIVRFFSQAVEEKARQRGKEEGGRNSWGESRESSGCCKLWEKGYESESYTIWSRLEWRCILICVCVCACVRVCVREREREREKERKKTRDRDRKKKEKKKDWLVLVAMETWHSRSMELQTQ